VRERLEQRLAQLKAEFEQGQKMLADLETQQANLRSTLLRISGAVQVLEELLASGQPTEPTESASPE
jgi:ABC-type transporter Mla subunit MlaD